MKFVVNVLLTCILYCEPGPPVITTVCMYSRQILIMDITFCSCTIFVGDAVATQFLQTSCFRSIAKIFPNFQYK